tara:strand:+ start:175 stop:783 length:609 start_codon:yes stop_codon:yes gene_type:complete
MTFTLPNLPYDYNALEPHIDETTMQIHHGKHHQAYIDKLNKALEGTELENKTIKEILSNPDSLPQEKRTAIINNGGGHANHSLFWEIMTPNHQEEPKGNLKEAINKSFESFENFKEEFSQAATTRFGSGWAWLIINKNKELKITSTPNQDSPIMDGNTPILGLDVWEHAYYLKYQNKRPDYITAFFNVINWEKVEQLFEEAK